MKLIGFQTSSAVTDTWMRAYFCQEDAPDIIIALIRQFAQLTR